MIELQPVHLSANQVVIDLLVDWPAADIEVRQTPLVLAQLAMLALHCRRRVVGDPVVDHGLVENPEIVKQRQQISVSATLSSAPGRLGAATREGERAHGYQQEC